MAINSTQCNRTRSLASQINSTEQAIKHRQHGVANRMITLSRTVHQALIAPGTLLLAGGVGFITGELTACPSNKLSTQNSQSPLSIALQLVISAHSLYAALPIPLMMKYWSVGNREN